MVVFFLHAMVVGGLFSRIPEIQKGLGLSETTFGLALMGLPAGVFFGSPLVSQIIERLGPRRTLMLLVPVFGASPLLVALASGAQTLFAALAVLGLALTISNIAMNVEADRIEADTGSRIQNRCHGAWGLGVLFISASGAGAIAAGISPLAFYGAMFVAILVIGLVIIRRIVASPPRQHSGSPNPRRFAMPTMGSFLVMGFAFSGVWLQGATNNWSVIYLRDALGAVEWLAATALPVIVGTLTLGRFLADGWVDRYGVVLVSRILAVVSFAGLALIVFAPTITVALAGCALIGLGVSTVYPQAISAAAQWGDRPATENVAAFSSLQTLVAFASPPIFGIIAGELGLRAAFALILPFPLVALYFARYLASRPTAAARPAF